jgi:hypothetical protein
MTAWNLLGFYATTTSTCLFIENNVLSNLIIRVENDIFRIDYRLQYFRILPYYNQNP